MVAKCEAVNRVQAATLGSVLISVYFCVCQRPVMKLLEVTWGWIHFRVVEIRQN